MLNSLVACTCIERGVWRLRDASEPLAYYEPRILGSFMKHCGSPAFMCEYGETLLSTSLGHLVYHSAPTAFVAESLTPERTSNSSPTLFTFHDAYCNVASTFRQQSLSTL